MKIIVAFSISFLLLVSCNSNQKSKPNSSKTDSVKTDKPIIYSDSINFIATFVPAFDETAKFQIFKLDTLSYIQLLIYNRIPPSIDEIADTLYFLKKRISKDQFRELDTALLQKVRRGFKEKSRLGLDGIGINYSINYHGEINEAYFWSPHTGDAYDYTIKAFRIFKFMFRDSIVDNYIDEIDSYLPYSLNKFMRYDENKPINKLRDRVYRKKNRKR